MNYFLIINKTEMKNIFIGSLFLIMLTSFDNKLAFRFVFATLFTALVSKPKLVKLEIKPNDEVNNPKIPTPEEPTKTATTLFLIKETTILINCTEPRMVVALAIS